MLPYLEKGFSPLFFEQGVLHFRLQLGLANYTAGPVAHRDTVRLAVCPAKGRILGNPAASVLIYTLKWRSGKKLLAGK